MPQKDHTSVVSPSSNRSGSWKEREMGDARVKEEALQILGLFEILPRLVVFDLDYTLWPFYWYDRFSDPQTISPHSNLGLI